MVNVIKTNCFKSKPFLERLELSHEAFSNPRWRNTYKGLLQAEHRLQTLPENKCPQKTQDMMKKEARLTSWGPGAGDISGNARKIETALWTRSRCLLYKSVPIWASFFWKFYFWNQNVVWKKDMTYVADTVEIGWNMMMICKWMCVGKLLKPTGRQIGRLSGTHEDNKI